MQQSDDPATPHTGPTLDHIGLIESEPVGSRQITLLLMCAAVLFTDGFDTQAIGYVAPELAREWQLGRGALGSVFSAGLFGLLLGSLVFSPVADRIGRKWVVIGSTAAFGVLTLLTPLAHDVTTLTVLRFLTGLGLGGAMPNAVALTAEISPHRRRATMVMAMFCGFSLGAAVGGLIAAAMIPLLGWRSVFVLGGLAPLVLALVLSRTLPESVRFLTLKGGQDRRVGGILAWLFLGRAIPSGTRFVVDEPALRGVPALLRSYDAERRPVFLSTARDFIERSIEADRDFLCAFDPARDRAAFERHWAERSSGAKGEVNAFEPNYEGSPIVFGPPGARSSAKGAHVHRAQPGHHLAPQPLSTTTRASSSSSGPRMACTSSISRHCGHATPCNTSWRLASAACW